MRNRFPYALIVGAVVVIDQITKVLVARLMVLHESRPIIEGLLSLTYVQNRGAAFGILSDADLPYQSALFSVVSLLALVAIALYALRLPISDRLSQTALALVMGGAVGNLIDRSLHGYVIDFVDFYWKTHHWPAFNVADSCISVGVCLLLLDIVRSPAETAKHDTPLAAGE
jgi:signal peptidase II